MARNPRSDRPLGVKLAALLAALAVAGCSEEQRSELPDVPSVDVDLPSDLPTALPDLPSDLPTDLPLDTDAPRAHHLRGASVRPGAGGRGAGTSL